MLDNYLIKQNLELTGILASIGDGVIAVDLAGGIVFVNASAEQISGWKAEEAVGQDFDNVFKLYNLNSGKTEPNPVFRALKEKRPVGLHAGTVLLAKDGSHKYLSASCAPIDQAGEGLGGVVVVFRDVTKYRELVQKCQNEEANLRTIFNAVPVGMFILDEAALIGQINETALKMLGKERESVIGKKFGDGACCIGSMEDKRGCGYGSSFCGTCRLNLAISLASEGLTTVDIEFERVLFQAGREKAFWFQASVAPIVDGNATQIAVALVDITAKKRHEIAVAQSRDFYMRIFESFPTLIWKSDFDMKIEYVNSHWREFTMQPVSEALGYGWLKYIHPEDRKKLFAYAKQLKQGIWEEQEIRILHRSGEYRWLYCVNRLNYNIDGVPEGYIGMGIDITDRKIAEEGLIRYKVLSEKARDVILFMDMAGNIFDANEAATREYGYVREEFLRLTIFDLCGRGNETAVKRQMKKAKGGIIFETVHYRKDGTSFPVEVSSQGTVIGGKEVLVSIIRNIFERKIAEKELKRAKEEAEAAVKAKSEFLANMSHEIRTPINGIVGMIDLTLMTELSEEQEENLSTAKSCARSLLQIINDILDFSKIEAGKLVVETINFDISGFIDEVIKTHLASAALKGLYLDAVLSPCVPKIISGSPHRLRQVLDNLINNGIKFTEKGSVILSVRAKYLVEDKVELTFSVADTGIGIATADTTRLFQAFSQVDGSITRRFGGTGLGLTISRRLVEMMGGKMGVESEKERGSTFYFTLPCKTGTLAEDKPQTEEVIIKSEAPLKLLLVDDDNLGQKVAKRILSKMGHSVDEAGNGFEALALLAEHEYDAILMDIHMPELDGVETTKRIRESEGSSRKHTPIIALTAYALSGDRERFLAAGMDEYVSKPIQIPDLFRKLEALSQIRKMKGSLAADKVRISESGDIIFDSCQGGISREEAALVWEEIASWICQIVTAEEQEGMERVEIIAHELKNLANRIDAEELKNEAFKTELALRRGNVREASGHIERIRRILAVYQRSKIIS
ncbi:MAG: arcB1 [Firmicutes bacterium]|nr:arcB1 [Bacillota bacterium]